MICAWPFYGIRCEAPASVPWVVAGVDEDLCAAHDRVFVKWQADTARRDAEAVASDTDSSR